MPRLSPVCSEFRASPPLHASRSTSAASSALLPRGFTTLPPSFIFLHLDLFYLSTQPSLLSFFVSMRSLLASFSLPVTRPSPASPRVSRFFFHVSSESNRTPNHALQRTAPRVTVAADSGLGVFSPSHRCPTSVAFFCAPPSQLPRHAPPSLSLGSLGRSSTVHQKHNTL